MPTMSVAVASTAERPGGILAQYSLLTKEAPVTRSARADMGSAAHSAFARYTSGRPMSETLKGVLESILGAKTAVNAADNNQREVFGENATSDNNNARRSYYGDVAPDGPPVEDDSNTNTKLAVNSADPTQYGPAAFTDTAVTQLTWAARIANGDVPPAEVQPRAALVSSALESYYNRTSLPPRLPDPEPVLDESNDNPGGHVAPSSDNGVAETSGGRYSAYGFSHFYGRNRSSAYDNDGISGATSELDDFMKRLFG